jgi:hypothetical protein
MANNLLMLTKLDTDTMAFASLLVSIVAALAAIFAAFCANTAAFYAKKAATKRDLTRVEQNTQHLEHVSNKILSIDTQVQPQPQAQRDASSAQPQQEAPQLQAQHISISVEGEAMGEVPLELCLTLQDSSIRVSRVETLNEVGKTLSSSPSKATDNALVFKSILTPKKVRQWWSAGESTSEGGGTSVLRVYLLVDESRREVFRDIPVSIVEELRSIGIASLVVWTIKGSI